MPRRPDSTVPPPQRDTSVPVPSPAETGSVDVSTNYRKCSSDAPAPPNSLDEFSGDPAHVEVRIPPGEPSAHDERSCAGATSERVSSSAAPSASTSTSAGTSGAAGSSPPSEPSFSSASRGASPPTSTPSASASSADSTSAAGVSSPRSSDRGLIEIAARLESAAGFVPTILHTHDGGLIYFGLEQARGVVEKLEELHALRELVRTIGAKGLAR